MCNSWGWHLRKWTSLPNKLHATPWCAAQQELGMQDMFSLNYLRIYFFAVLCVCVCVWCISTYMWHVYCVWKPEVTMDGLDCPALYFLREGFLTQSGAHQLAAPAGQWALEIFLSLYPSAGIIGVHFWGWFLCKGSLSYKSNEEVRLHQFKCIEG